MVPSDAKTPDPCYYYCYYYFALLSLILYQQCGLRCIKINIKSNSLMSYGFDLGGEGPGCGCQNEEKLVCFWGEVGIGVAI